MWPLQPTLNVIDRCQSIAKAALASGGILVFMLLLVGGGFTRPERVPHLPTVYLFPSETQEKESVPPEEIPVNAEVPDVITPTMPLTLPFDTPALTNARVAVPDYTLGTPTMDRIMVVPMSFTPTATPTLPVQAAPKAVSTIALAKPTHRVPPQYPIKARQQGIEGFVTMDLFIDTEGRVEDVRIVKEKPEGVFKASATKVVRRWVFVAPPQPAWQRLTIRYELEK